MLDNDLRVYVNNELRQYRKQELFLFQSNDKVVSESPGSDFNLMIHHSLRQHRVAVTDVFRPGPGYNLVFTLAPMILVLQGSTYELSYKDALVIQNGPAIQAPVLLPRKAIIAQIGL